MSYRREFAGHMHTTKRCYLCLEILTLTQHGGLRSETRAWGMRWCQDCLKQWTIQSEDMDKVSGLRPLLEKSGEDSKFGSLRVNTFKDSTELSWKPYVDAVLRKSIGIDFDTAVAKEEYMRQVSKALTSTRQPVTALRQALRREIVQIAQDLSTSPNYDNVPANLAKQTFARPTELSIFLFRAGLLYEENMFDPYDPDEAWLSDPTKSLTLSRHVRRKLGDAGWKKQKAKDMLSMLFHPHIPGGGVTAFEQAARSRHIQRISRNMSADSTIKVLNKEFPPQESPFIRTPTCSAADGEHTTICHLDVLLAKLYIYRGAFHNLPQLSPHELKLAKEVYFRKLALQTCITCPHSGLLILLRGVEGVVQHCHEAHPEKFWSSDDWTISG
jgi:hypothetical protein